MKLREFGMSLSPSSSGGASVSWQEGAWKTPTLSAQGI
jgi:hypothetical protein